MSAFTGQATRNTFVLGGCTGSGRPEEVNGKGRRVSPNSTICVLRSTAGIEEETFRRESSRRTAFPFCEFCQRVLLFNLYSSPWNCWPRRPTNRLIASSYARGDSRRFRYRRAALSRFPAPPPHDTSWEEPRYVSPWYVPCIVPVADVTVTDVLRRYKSLLRILSLLSRMSVVVSNYSNCATDEILVWKIYFTGYNSDYTFVPNEFFDFSQSLK